jgi:hypothetical protein
MLESRGTVPIDLLTILNQGPGAHIRQHAFSRKELDHETTRTRRVKEIRLRAVALLGSALVTVVMIVTATSAQCCRHQLTPLEF